jgi:hypothetical protein
MRQDRRRAKRLAREAKLQLDLGPNAEGAIAVQRILEGGEEGDLERLNLFVISKNLARDDANSARKIE